MTTHTTRRPITVALLGNPNTGKSTLFSALVGVRQRTGNYPGVTVEKKTGRMTLGGTVCDVIDLPGTYSLAPHSPDEMVAVDVLLGRQAGAQPPDVIVCIVDASNLSRNLYLVSQLIELQRPLVVALNMVDVASGKGISIDVQRLAQNLAVPVVPIQANRQTGLACLTRAIEAAAQTSAPAIDRRDSPLPAEWQAEVTALEAISSQTGSEPLPRYLLERLLLDTGYLETAELTGVTPAIRAAVATARARFSTAGQSPAVMETIARYQWVSQVVDGVVTQTQQTRITASDRLDRILTHRFWGPLIFLLVMSLIFQAVFNGAVVFMDWIEAGVGGVGEWLAMRMPAGALQSLLIDGVIGGVGSVLVFLPQIVILFFFIAVLEDCGYMARAAFLMDRLMSRIGLSGKSFIPLLSSFACAVPAIMGTRVIENRRDRLVTILIAPLMTCSARLPVYFLLIAAFIPATSLFALRLGPLSWSLTLQHLTLLGLYSLGIAAAILAAIIMKRTILPGDTPPFVLELPSYKFPDVRVVFHRMWERAWAFVVRAGTLIFAVSIVVWAAAFFPHDTATVELPYAARRAEIARAQQTLARSSASSEQDRQAVLAAQTQQLDNEIAGAYMRQSYLGRVGRAMEPAFRPLGWDWRIGCGVLASFPAREVVVGTLGVIYNLGGEEEGSGLRDSLRQATWDGTDRPVFTIPVALSIMVFFALCAQCVSTLAIIRRETNSWRWPLFSFGYMTILAYVGAFLTYQIGSRL